MYESRIILVDRYHYSETECAGTEVARFDLCGMGYEQVDGKFFTDLFTEDIDFNLFRMQEQEYEYDEQYDEKHRRDCYGEHCKYASVVDVLGWLMKSDTAKKYRRAKAFYGALQSYYINQYLFDDLVVVHYGY